jgi:hypothetical protein
MFFSIFKTYKFKMSITKPKGLSLTKEDKNIGNSSYVKPSI